MLGFRPTSKNGLNGLVAQRISDLVENHDHDRRVCDKSIWRTHHSAAKCEHTPKHANSYA